MILTELAEYAQTAFILPAEKVLIKILKASHSLTCTNANVLSGSSNMAPDLW